MFRGQHTKKHVTLRYIPPELIRDDDVAEKLRTRHHFRAIFYITVSPPVADAKGEVVQIKMLTQFKESLGDKFITATFSHMNSILNSKGKVTSLVDLLRFRAGTFFEAILLILSVTEFADREYDDADAYLTALDSRLSDRFGKSVHPREYVPVAPIRRTPCLHCGRPRGVGIGWRGCYAAYGR